MTFVGNALHTIESNAWHGIAKAAESQPIAARFLAVPILLGTLVIEELAYPASLIEGIVQGAISVAIAVKDFFVSLANDGVEAPKEELKKHNFSSKIYPYASLNSWFAPITALIRAVVHTAYFIVYPLQTAKIEAARLDLNEYLTREHDDIETASFVAAIAYRHFEKFNADIWAAPTDENLTDIHFIESEDEKNRIEIDIKHAVEDRNDVIKFYNKHMELYKEQIAKANAKIVDLERYWYDVQKNMINPDKYVEVRPFDPTV